MGLVVAMYWVAVGSTRMPSRVPGQEWYDDASWTASLEICQTSANSGTMRKPKNDEEPVCREILMSACISRSEYDVLAKKHKWKSSREGNDL